MGGSITAKGVVSPVATANIGGDPHAADIVFTTPWRVSMVGRDVTTRVKLNDDILLSIKDQNARIGQFIYDVSRFYMNFFKSIGITDGCHVNDPSAIAYLIDKNLFQTEKGAVRVVTDGIAIGQTIMQDKNRADNPGPWFGKPQVEVALGVDSQGVLQLFKSTMTQ